MIPALVSLLILAAPSTPPIKLAAPALTYVNLDEKTGEFFVDSLAQQLIKQGIQVSTQKEIAAVIGLERQKQLLGCSGEGGRCMIELAGALGVDGIVTGSLAKIGAGLALNLKIIAANDGRMLAAQSVRVKNEDALLDWLEGGAAALANDTKHALGRGVPDAGTPASPTAVTARTEPPAGAEQVRVGPKDLAASPGPDKYEVEWGTSWYPARVLKTRADGFTLIHYEGYADSWDEWVAPSRLRKKAPEPPKIEVEWHGTWYKATILERRASDGASYIHYDGYGKNFDEWVPPERLRIDGVRATPQ